MLMFLCVHYDYNINSLTENQGKDINIVIMYQQGGEIFYLKIYNCLFNYRHGISFVSHGYIIITLNLG